MMHSISDMIQTASIEQFFKDNWLWLFVILTVLFAVIVLQIVLRLRALRRVAEQKREIEEVLKIAAMKHSFDSLMDHMPILTFSKDTETGAYLTCNRLFAEYALKRSPADVIGLTDAELFDARTAEHYVEVDRKVLAMDKPYVLFEDVLDAAGKPRRFHTTKLKFCDAEGKLCLLGMTVDVTELERARAESEKNMAAYREALSTGAVYENIADALSEDYFDLYYVDIQTDEYVEYGSKTTPGHLSVENRGQDFFGTVRHDATVFIHEEDLDRFLEAMQKERLLAEIQKNGSFSIQYRLLIEYVPTYVELKAKQIDSHIIIGVHSIDVQVKDRMAAEQAAEDRKSYRRLSALNGNLIVLYFVDPETEEYTEFSSSREYENLGIAKQGEHFFRTSYENSLRAIHLEDQPLFHAMMTKANILHTIEQDGVFSLDYRLMAGDHPIYVRLKAAKIEEDGREVLIIALFDEDAQIRQEQEYARNLSDAKRIAAVDALTGVKNKYSYLQWEEQINARIRSGEQEPFAVVVCDINNLKTVNDVYGHKAGDECIRRACARICGVFGHSPVFRVGGDEFVVLLFGGDYDRRAELMEQINVVSTDDATNGMHTPVAAGMVEFNREQHYSLLPIFEAADMAMYEKKQAMKRAQQADKAPAEKP